MHLVDAHTHLNSDELYPHREKHLTEFIAHGGVGLMNVGVDPLWNRRAVEIAEKSVALFGTTCSVKATVGGHPSEVSFGKIVDTDAVLVACDDLEKLIIAHDACIVAVGECGIDAHYPGFTHEIAALQQEFFRAQCLLARKYALPVVIHSRDAFSLTVEVLEEFTDLAIYFHCWGYGVAEAKQLLTHFPRLWFGFCGNSTYPKAGLIRESFQFLVAHPSYKAGSVGLLVETDAPWLAPQTKRGQQHLPVYIPEQYHFLADLAEQSPEAFAERVYHDRLRFSVRP